MCGEGSLKEVGYGQNIFILHSRVPKAEGITVQFRESTFRAL